LSRVELSGRLEPTLDPCAALMAPFVLAPGADIEIVFLLGQATGQEEARRLLRRYRDPVQVEAAFKDVCKRWDQTLNAVQVRTPNQALDLLLNGWGRLSRIILGGACFGLALLIGSHRPIAFFQIVAHDVRPRQIIQEAADVAWTDDLAQAAVAGVFDRDGQFVMRF